MAQRSVTNARLDSDAVARDVFSILNGSTPTEVNSAGTDADCHCHAAGKVVDDNAPVGPGAGTTDVTSADLVID